MLPENEVIQYEDQLYVNPETSLNEQTAFIDNLRNIQNQNTAQINQDTYNLGTAVPSNLGGLTGPNSYYTSRYQTPQSVSLAADLRATAQAQALNDVLQNELAIAKQRYNNAYRAARQRAANYGGGGGGGNPGGNNPNTANEIFLDPTDVNSADGHYVYWLGQDGNVWVNKNGQTSNLGAANMVNGQWDGMASGSAGSMSGNGTKINDPVPPNPDNYYITGEEQTKRIQERSGISEQWVNILKLGSW